jgi:hypothetical protein
MGNGGFPELDAAAATRLISQTWSPVSRRGARAASTRPAWSKTKLARPLGSIRGYSRPGRGGEIRIGSIAVEVEGTGAGPFFHCPECGRRCRHLYLVEPISCRCCAKLDYSSRRVMRAAPGAARIARLRRQIGAEQYPFTPLPPRPPRARWRYDAIVARIEAEETKVARAYVRLGDDLERRLRSWRAKRRKGYSAKGKPLNF